MSSAHDVPRAARRAAAAVSQHVEKSHGRQKRVELGIVRTVEPLSVEMVEASDSRTSEFVLGEDDVLLGASARKYDQDHGLEVGDTLVMVQTANDDYVVLDVIATKEVLKGVGTVMRLSKDFPLAVSGTADVAGVTGTVSGQAQTGRHGRHIVGKLPVYNEKAKVIGWVAVYKDLP